MTEKEIRMRTALEEVNFLLDAHVELSNNENRELPVADDVSSPP